MSLFAQYNIGNGVAENLTMKVLYIRVRLDFTITFSSNYFITLFNCVSFKIVFL